MDIFDEGILELDGIEESRKRKRNVAHTYNGLPVPRVTQILDMFQDNSHLINWAANLGYAEYIKNKKKATTVGSAVHEMIEYYLTKDDFLNLYGKVPASYMKEIITSYWNLVDWFEYVDSLCYKVTPLFIEKELVCPWYGGTCDCIANINGKNYILDFKTSKKISTSYIIQVCAYMWIVNNGYADKEIPHIDGVGIIRGDKYNEGSFEEYFLNEDYYPHNQIIQSAQQCFGSYINAYFRNINIDYLVRNYMKTYSMEDALGEKLDVERYQAS